VGDETRELYDDPKEENAATHDGSCGRKLRVSRRFFRRNECHTATSNFKRIALECLCRQEGPSGRL
jgi:hypothetical protein